MNDTSVAIDEATLEGLNEAGGEKNIATVTTPSVPLVGTDLSETGPGDRPYTDYVVGNGGTAKPGSPW